MNFQHWGFKEGVILTLLILLLGYFVVAQIQSWSCRRDTNSGDGGSLYTPVYPQKSR